MSEICLGYTLVNIDSSELTYFETHDKLVKHLEDLLEAELTDRNTQLFIDDNIFVFKGRPITMKCKCTVEVGENEREI